MLFIALKEKIQCEIEEQFDNILSWINTVGEVQDVTIPEQVIERKNFLIVGIYSTHEHILETSINYFFLALYNEIERETGHNLWAQSERLKIESYTRNNHNGTREGLENMLTSILGNAGAKSILKNIQIRMADDYLLLCQELSDFKKYRDKQTHSSKNFFSSDTVGIGVDIENSLIIVRINRIKELFKFFCECLYDELNKLYKLP